MSELRRRRERRLADARLYVLVDGGRSSAAFRDLVQALVGAGVHAIQLRDKRLADRELLERARLLQALTAGTTTLFIVNDRPDLALLAGADGVHVGQEELPVADVRRVVGDQLLVGVSTHSLPQATAAVRDQASYLGVGPTFVSPTKAFDHYPGLELLGEVAPQIEIPAFAIGGITLPRLEEVLATGVRRVAVGAAITAAADQAAAAQQFLARLMLCDRGGFARRTQHRPGD
ncbi:MAG: thiamine phosphate synthase [Planctomycetales bacterium]|nr:thiamine phosphate synthase [Planctomycetales bacterium]